MKGLKTRLILFVIFFSHASALAQVDLGVNRILEPQSLNYLISTPQGYSAEGAGSPLILFLHGGDRSNTKHHPMRYALEAGLEFPFMVVAPHCSNGCSWSSADIDALLNEVVKTYNVDQKRIYITGYSMGGYGTWSVISRFPNWFAAAAPIAGGGNSRTICSAKNVSVLAFHGDKDSVTPYSGSKRLVDALVDCGATARLETFKGGDHWIWPAIYKDKRLYDWFLTQVKTD